MTVLHALELAILTLALLLAVITWHKAQTDARALNAEFQALKRSTERADRVRKSCLEKLASLSQANQDAHDRAS